MPAGCAITPLPPLSEGSSGIAARWLRGSGIAAGSVAGAFYQGSGLIWWELDQRAPLTVTGHLVTDSARSVSVLTDLSGSLSTVYATSVSFPDPGCWQLQAQAGGQRFQATVYVYPKACRPPSMAQGSPATSPCEPPQQ